MTGTVAVLNCIGYYKYQTNVNPALFPFFELNGNSGSPTSLSNTIINLQITADYNYATNNPEAIGYFGSSSVAYINNLTTIVLNTNNLSTSRLYEPILFESSYGIQVGPQQPLNTFVAYNLNGTSTNAYPNGTTAGDWTKLGMDEIYPLAGNGISVLSNASFALLSVNAVINWDSALAASPNYNDFLNHIYGYPFAANWNFTGLSGGVSSASSVILTNSYGYSIQISAANGMFHTNIASGPTALCLSNNGDKFIITNLGVAPNTVMVDAPAVASGAYNGNNAERTSQQSMGYLLLYKQNSYSTTGTFAPIATYESYTPNINFISSVRLRVPSVL